MTGAAPERPGAAALPGHLSTDLHCSPLARSSCSPVIDASKGTLWQQYRKSRSSPTENQLMSQKAERKAVDKCVKSALSWEDL